MRNKKKHLYWICNKWVSVYHVIYSVQDNILVKMDDTQAYMWKTESIKTVKTSIIEVSGCFGAGVDTCMTNLSVHQHDGSLGKKKKKKQFLVSACFGLQCIVPDGRSCLQGVMGPLRCFLPVSWVPTSESPEWRAGWHQNTTFLFSSRSVFS